MCFNGKRAAQKYMEKREIAYSLQDMKIGETAVFVAPSTSGAANGYWDERYYFELVGILKRISL